MSAVVAADDLVTLYREALTREPAFQSARYTLDAARERLTQVRAGLLPSVTLSGAGHRTEADISFEGAPAVERDTRSRNLQLEMRQPLLRMQNWVAYTQADWGVVQAEAQYAQAQQDMALRVAQAYFDALAAQDSLVAAESQGEAMRAQLEVATQGFQAGTAAITDVHEARSRMALTAADVIAARNELDIRRSVLEQIVGYAPAALARLKSGTLPFLPQSEDATVWADAARVANPEVRAREAAVEIAEREVRRQRADYLPSIDLTASASKNFESGTTNSAPNLETDTNSAMVGVQFSWPLYAGGITRARVREAKALEYRTRSDLEAARRAAAHSARQAFLAVLNGMAEVRAREEAVVSSEKAVAGNKIGYEAGTRINVDVLNAEQQLYTARRDLVRVRHETILQMLRLEAAAGQLTEDDIFSVNALLETAPNPKAE